jgi:hypothetical protein
MFVYIWKTPEGVPFYVGMGSTIARANPKGYKSRNRFCRAEVLRVGIDSIVVELHSTPDEATAKVKEQELIAFFGTVRSRTGTLTNISKGGERHETTEVTKLTLKALWATPAFREKVLAARVGQKRNLPKSSKESLRTSLASNAAMKPWSERNGKDADFDAKRIAGIKAAQPSRAAKMSDPVALAQRKARLTATLNSPEHKARRAAQNTPEYRAEASRRAKERWAKRKATTLAPT